MVGFLNHDCDKRGSRGASKQPHSLSFGSDHLLGTFGADLLTFVLFRRWGRFVLHWRNVGHIIFGSVEFFGKVVHVAEDKFPAPYIHHIA